MDRQKKIPSPSMKITRKLAQQSKGHSNLMNYYSKLSRDKSGAPVRWKMSQPVHIDEAAISGRSSPARASSGTATGSRSVSRESDGKRKGETDKLGKKVAERSKSRDSSAGSKSRKNSIERKFESETKARDTDNEAKSHVSRKSLKRNQEDVSTKQSRGKRISLSSVSTATHIPERMKRRPHSLDLNYNRNANLNGEDETFKSPELSPCTEVVKRKKGRPKQTPPTLEIETFIPTNSECKNAEDGYSEDNSSSIMPDVPFISQSNNRQWIANADIASSSERSSVGVIDQSGNKAMSRARGRPPKHKVSLMDVSLSIGKLDKHLYMDESKPSSSNNSSTVMSDVSFISQSNNHQFIADADLASSSERSSVGVIDQSGNKAISRPRGRPPKNKVSLMEISQSIGKLEKHLCIEETRPSAPKYKSLISNTKQAKLKSMKVGKYGKISQRKDDKASKIHSTVLSGKLLTETGVDHLPEESAVIFDSATVNGDMDDPEITFKQRSMDSNIKTPATQSDVKKTKTVKKDRLKTKAENSMTKFKKGVESAPKIKKKRIMMSHAIQTDAIDTLAHLATNDLRRKIHRKLLNKLNGGRKEENMSKYESKESKTDESMEENKLNESSTETDTNEYIDECQRVEIDDNIHDIGNALSMTQETVAQVDILSAIIEQKRLLSRENSQPDRLKRKTQEHVLVIPSENETEKEIADIGKQSDSESVCSELSVQSTLSRHTDCKIKTTTLVKTSDDEPQVRTRQRCEILPPGGNKRKRTLSGEFHLLDEVKLRKNQRNSDISEKKDDGRTDPLTERKLPISSTQLYVKNTPSTIPKTVKIMRKSKLPAHAKEKRIQVHRKEVLSKSRMLLNKTFSQPVQKRKLLPQHKKVKKVISKKSRQCAVVHTGGDRVHESNKCNVVNIPASESFCSESKEVVKTYVIKDKAVSEFDNLCATDENLSIAEPLSKIGDESENLNPVVKGEIDRNETASLPLDTKLESDELCTSDESVSSGLLTSTAIEVTEEVNVVKQEVDNDIKNVIPLNDNFTDQDEQKNRLDDNGCDTIQTNKIDDICMSRNSDYSEHGEMKEIGENCTEEEAYSNNIDYTIQSHEHVAVSKITEFGATVNKEQSVASNTDLVESIENTDANVQASTDSVTNDEVNCFISPRITEDIRLEATLSFPSEKVVKDDTCVNTEKERSEMHTIAFVVNEVVQGILYSVEHTLEELGNVRILDKVEITTDKMLENNPDIDTAGNDNDHDDKEGEVNDLASVSDSMINENNNITGNTCNHATIETGLEVAITEEGMFNCTTVIKKDDYNEHSVDEVDNGSDKKDTDLIQKTDDLTNIQSSNTEELLHDGTLMSDSKVSPESKEVSSIVGKTQRKRTYSNKGSKELNTVGRKIELRQKISRSPLDNIALKHSIEENEYYKNEALKANRREAKLKSKTAAMHAKASDAVTNNNVSILDNAKPNIDHTDNELVPQDIHTESEISDIVSENEIQDQTTCTLISDDLLKQCKPCSVLLKDFLKQLQINQQKRSETGSESEALENEKSTDVDIDKSYMKDTTCDEQDSVSKGQILNKTPKMAQLSQETLENRLISSFGNLETESGEQTARKTVPPLKIKLKGGVRRKTYMVESTIQPEAKKTVTENNKKSKGKSASLKSDSDSDKQKVHHHHKKRNKVLQLEHEPQLNLQSPSKPSLHPPVIPKDAYEANFLKFIKDKELEEHDGILKLASVPVSAKSVNQTDDGKAYKVQANGSLTVSASGDAATSTSTSKSDTGLNEAAIVAQKKKAENAGQIMESYAKFREKIMKESVGRKTITDSKELDESNSEIVECNKNILSTVSCKNNYIRANDIPGNLTEVNTESLTDISVNAEIQKMDSADDLMRFICNHCVFSSDTTFEMLEHTKLNHANDVKYICPVCEKVCVDKEAILHHCETSHIGQEVMYSCLPDFRDGKSEMDKLPENERESANHGNIFDRIHNLIESNDNNSSNQQVDVNSLHNHYLKTSAEADSTTGVPSDKLAKSDNSSTEAKKISEASDTAVEEPDNDEGMDIQIVEVVSLKNQPDMVVPQVPVAASSVSGVGSIAPQTELNIPTFIPRDVPPQPQVSAVNQMKSAQPVKDYNVPNKSSGRLGNTFKCEKCNVHAPLLGAMVAHLRNVHRDILRLFQCPYCRDLEAETEAKIHHHIRLFHPTDNPNPPVALSEPAKSNLKTLSIPLPENRFTDNYLVEKDIYMCLKCKTHMPTLETIYDHLEAEHIEVFVSVCPFCKTFKSKDENRVNEHIVTAHQRSFDELPLSLAIDGNQFVRVPSLIKEKTKNANKSRSQQQTGKGILPEQKSNVMSLTQKNLQQHQLLQQRQLLGKQVPRMPTNPELARMMSQVNRPQYTSTVDQTLLKRPVQRHSLPQTSVQSAAQQKTVASQQHNSHHQLVQGAKKRKLNLSDTIANLTIQKQAEQNALMTKTAVVSTATGSTLPTYAETIQLQNQIQQLHQPAHGLPPPLLRGPPPLIRFDQLIGVADESVNNSQSSNKPSTQNPVSQRLATGSPLGVSPQPSTAAKPIQSALFDTSGQSSFGSVNRKPVLNVPLVPRSGNRHTPKSSGMTATGSPLDLSSKSTPSNSPAQTPSPSPNVATENPEAFKIFNLKPITPQPAPQGQQLPFQQFVHQVRPNTSNTLAYRPATPHVPNSSQSQQVMGMPVNAALLGGNVIVSIPNVQPNLPTMQLQTLQQLVRLGAPVQTGMAQLQNLQPLVRVAAPAQPPTTSIQQALQSPRGLAVGHVSPGVQHINLQQLPPPTPSPQQINANLNLPMFKCPYCPKLTKLAPAEVQAHIEALHPGSSVMFKQCDT